jgi:hypothetical protein
MMIVARAGAELRPEPRPNRADMDKEASAPMSKKTLLMKAADELLRKARFDAVTGEKKDREYKRKQHAAIKRARRLSKLKERKFGKLGPASRVRRPPMIEASNETNATRRHGLAGIPEHGH